MIVRHLVEARNWTVDEALNHTLRQIRILTMDKVELKDRNKEYQTKKAREFQQLTIDKAVDNLLAGKRWDTK